MQVSGEDFVSPEFSPCALCEQERRRAVVQKMEQSAKQLDVRKNVLPNGFDGSTENGTSFKRIFQKK
ncbi:MAG: hypothetical protein BGO25_13970 [Acidobacteriales bacterium 59-55]|nr:MAG: hypothetical protein BGO25_13970 [Acidobacteriales bacterium 59-55]